MALQDGSILLFGQLPLLEVDGLYLVQSQAIVWCATNWGSLVSIDKSKGATINLVTKAKIDMVAEVV